MPTILFLNSNPICIDKSLLFHRVLSFIFIHFFRRSETRPPEDDEEEEEEILGSDDDEQEDPKDYVKGKGVAAILNCI